MSKTNRPASKKAPPPLVTIDGDESEPAVKQEAEQEADSPVVADVKKKMEKIEKLAKGAITQAGTYLARVLYLEGMIDQKSDFIKTKQANDDDMEKKMDELKEELEDAKKHIAKLVSQTHEIKDELIEDRCENVTLQNNVRKEQKTIAELEKKVHELTMEKEESEKEKEELRRRLMEMEKKMGEKNGSVPIDDAPVDGEETRAELREEREEEPMERMEMGEQMEDAFNDHILDTSGLDGQDDVLRESGEEENETVDQDLRDEGEVKNRRRSSRNASKSLKYTDSVEESDEEEEPTVKKMRTESVEKKEKKKVSSCKGGSQSMKKDNDAEKNELKCPECDFSSNSVIAWIAHLKNKHSTTPALAGCLLRCDCGYKSYGHWHINKCKVSNFTIIRTGDGTILRLTDTVATPQCVLCEEHPQTLRGYNYHLKKHHKTTLQKNGIFLLCSCGTRYYTDSDRKKHDKKCTGRDFTLHKLDED